MNATLKNRQMQIPGGFKFTLPQVKFTAPPFQSFDSLVGMVLQVVLANPQLARKNGWPTDRAGVTMWVDRYNAMLCDQNNWREYINVNKDIDPPKYPPPPGAHPAGALAAAGVGAKTLADWFGEGAAPVAIKQAEQRAAVCSKCEFNRPGDLGNWFTRAVSEMIRAQISAFGGLKITTTRDSELGVCDMCSCPLKLKVHVPLRHIVCHLPDNVWSELPEHCWMLTERKCLPMGDKNNVCMSNGSSDVNREADKKT